MPLCRRDPVHVHRPVRNTADEAMADMAHEIAKLLLEKAGTFLERAEAIRTAMSLGMPLRDIEEYLDWLDHVNPAVGDRSGEESSEN
jgi:hypothetical protein